MGCPKDPSTAGSERATPRWRVRTGRHHILRNFHSLLLSSPQRRSEIKNILRHPRHRVLNHLFIVLDLSRCLAVEHEMWLLKFPKFPPIIDCHWHFFAGNEGAINHKFTSRQSQRQTENWDKSKVTYNVIILNQIPERNLHSHFTKPLF